MSTSDAKRCPSGHLLLYQQQELNWICDGCDGHHSAKEFPSSFRCRQGCDYDLCNECHSKINGKRGVPEDADTTGIPSKAKKTDLVTMLVEEDGKKKQDGSKVNLTESSGSLSKASENSSKEEGWIIETKFISSRCRDEPDIKIVGIFTSKEKAIENAKKAFEGLRMDYSEDADGWDNEGLEDYSKKIDKKSEKGCKGGVLFQMDISGEGDTISVSIYKCFIDKPIKSIDKAMNDADSEEDDIANSDDEESEYE